MQYKYYGDGVATGQRPWASFLLLVLGIFSRTRILLFGTIAISELMIFPIAPLLFLINYKKLKRDGFLPLILMLFGLVIALLVSSYVNHSPFPYIVKAGAVFYSLFCYVVVFHSLIRNNYKSMYLFWVGFAISSVITLFAFNPTATVSDVGFEALSSGGAVDLSEAMSGQMFWMDKIKSFGQIPIFGGYMKLPIIYPVLYALIYSAVLILTTISGRSAILTTWLAVAIMVLAGRSRRKMLKLGRRIWVLVIIGIAVVFIFKFSYVFAVENKLLGVAAQEKYEGQTQRGTGLVSMLIGGRQEMFIDFIAAFDNPIFGLGPRPADKNGYAEKFLLKYGTDLEIRLHMYYKGVMERCGMPVPLRLHSIIAEFWAQYGIFGFAFWCWILYLVYWHIKKYMASIPQWYGYFAISIPTFIWDVFFSTFAGRETFACLFVCLFFARAIGQGRLQLPCDMEVEAGKYD